MHTRGGAEVASVSELVVVPSVLEADVVLVSESVSLGSVAEASRSLVLPVASDVGVEASGPASPRDDRSSVRGGVTSDVSEPRSESVSLEPEFAVYRAEVSAVDSPELDPVEPDAVECEPVKLESAVLVASELDRSAVVGCAEFESSVSEPSETES